MAFVHLTALLALSATTFAQSSQITWASFVYTFYGEKIPSLTSGPYNLTPLGANQLLDAGSLIRSRYISAPSNGSQLTTAEPINGISVNDIDNSQLYSLSTDDEFISSSAMAFFQGLYPPRGIPVFDNESTLSNGSVDSFPLDGYQYPNIGTVSSLDFNYIWIAGNIGCTNYEITQVEQLESLSFSGQIAATQPFYDSLASTLFWDYDPSIVNFGNAWILYEYALYQYNHNRSNPVSSSDLSQLYNLASQQQFELNTPDSLTTIPSIAGQTLASAVLQQFQHTIASSGVADKLTLMFGSFEPFLSFFSLSELSTGPSASMFNSLPNHGSSMIFELFSNPSTSTSANENLTTPFPGTDELFVRFLFRNGTSDTDPIIEYPLFGRGPSEDDMSWIDFVQGMGDFSLNDVVDWCDACNSITLFCEAIATDTSNTTTPVSSSSKKSISPVIGGVIGATVTLGVAILVAIILGLLGFRLDYHEKRAKGGVPDVGGITVLKRSGSGTAGGFKGAEKLASDTDLTLKSGAGASVIRHERVGSWELNESPTSAKGLDKDIESGRMERVVSGADYGRRSEENEHVDPFGDPVKVAEQV